ncbi:MAG: hypothetical protein AAFY22_00970 [Pseudomonadota bacterium]
MSLSEKQVSEIKSNMSELEKRRRASAQARPDAARAADPKQAQPAGEAGALSEDAQWARQNLRHGSDGPYLDIANSLRIFERHPDFKGRFKFNEMINKVVDRGSVMVEWKISAIAADVQERFAPMMPFEIVNRALIIAANRAGESK